MWLLNVINSFCILVLFIILSLKTFFKWTFFIARLIYHHYRVEFLPFWQPLSTTCWIASQARGFRPIWRQLSASFFFGRQDHGLIPIHHHTQTLKIYFRFELIEICEDIQWGSECQTLKNQNHLNVGHFRVLYSDAITIGFKSMIQFINALVL